MRITIAQLEAFASIARLGTVNEASRTLNLAQPTVSLRLRELEKNLGVKLFERSGRTLRLSTQGTAMLEHADRVLSEIGRLKSRADGEKIRGLVRLGVSESFAISGLPDLLRRIAETYPDLRVDLGVEPSTDLVEKVLDHRLDLAIAVNPATDARLRSTPLGVQPATWAAAPGLGLPTVIRPANVLNQTILLNPSPYPNWLQTMEWFGAEGLEPLHVSICNTVPSVLAHLIGAGLGIGILPTKLIESQLRAGTLVTLECRPALGKSYLSAVQSAGDRQPILDAVIEVTRRVLSERKLLELV